MDCRKSGILKWTKWTGSVLHFRDKTEPVPNVPDVYERKNKMENKKTIIAIIIITILIVALVVISYLYNDFNMKQMAFRGSRRNS